ncbi:histamine N-methyltransferase [Scleropages formosus]|nr:histamine N-methyltransferase-like [Scleropages formosus]XP_018597055.1 histamine N-methyltransferase-like [Scleropages formosus]
MASSLSCLASDQARYHKIFQVFLDCSTEHQCMKEFILSTLPHVFTSIVQGKSSINILGVGSGSGEMDLEMLSQLHQQYPGVTVDYEVVEPCSQMMGNYKALVSKTPNLEKINFTWNQMSSSEFEKHWKTKQSTKKMDFIHMIQMLYYVTDPDATVSFFRSLLSENGKLLIILVAGESGWGRLWATHCKELCNSEISQCITTYNIKSYLDTIGVSYKSYLLPSTMDITECFFPGGEKGELLLDFLTEVSDFSKSASPELKGRVLDSLQKPECSTVVDGRVIFNNTLEALIVEP